MGKNEKNGNKNGGFSQTMSLKFVFEKKAFDRSVLLVMTCDIEMWKCQGLFDACKERLNVVCVENNVNFKTEKRYWKIVVGWSCDKTFGWKTNKWNIGLVSERLWNITKKIEWGKKLVKRSKRYMKQNRIISLKFNANEKWKIIYLIIISRKIITYFASLFFNILD